MPEPEAGTGKLPLVLAIHGGPYARDQWGFNSTHQWLANRGYAVLSVNYRGSTGFGKAFVTAADHEWGGRMHDDLIDAVDWAIAQGIADPKRVGFFGAQLWRLLGADGGDQDARGVRLYCRRVRHFQPAHLHGDDPALLGAVVQHLEKPARRSRHRSGARLSCRAIAAQPSRTRHPPDPDRPGHAGCQGGGGGIRADGQRLEGARRARHLCHVSATRDTVLPGRQTGWLSTPSPRPSWPNTSAAVTSRSSRISPAQPSRSKPAANWCRV